MSEEQSKYERRDVHVTALFSLVVSIVILLILALIVGYGLHRGYLAFVKRNPARMSPMADMRRLPPAPRLQVDATGELVKLQALTHEQLTTYGWIDAEKNIVHLPIERAKELTLERGLATRSQP